MGVSYRAEELGFCLFPYGGVLLRGNVRELKPRHDVIYGDIPDMFGPSIAMFDNDANDEKGSGRNVRCRDEDIIPADSSRDVSPRIYPESKDAGNDDP